AALARSAQRPAETLTPAAVQRRFDLTITARAGVFLADEGVLEPSAALAAMAARVRDLGGAVVYGAAVARIEPGAPMRALGAAGAAWEGDAVVLAPGAWAPPAFAQAAPALKHISPAAGTARLARTRVALSANIRGDGFYL